MVRGVRWYLAGCLILVMLAGCGRGFQFAEREKWRREAEIACLKSGTVKESVSVVRIEPIDGPGVCGADFPLKVAALGESWRVRADAALADRAVACAGAGVVNAAAVCAERRADLA
jgi:hypothetical protein